MESPYDRLVKFVRREDRSKPHDVRGSFAHTYQEVFSYVQAYMPSAKKPRLFALSCVAVVLLIAAYAMLPTSSPNPAIWRSSYTPISAPESDADHNAAVGYGMCMDLAAGRDFRARIMSIPAYPEEFCGCVARFIYRKGDSNAPYGTYRLVSNGAMRAIVQMGVNECLK